MTKILIAYYSRKGQNYVNGAIKIFPFATHESSRLGGSVN